MQEEIEIRNCKCCKPIDRDETKYQTDIIATSCIWRGNLEVGDVFRHIRVTKDKLVYLLNTKMSLQFFF